MAAAAQTALSVRRPVQSPFSAGTSRNFATLPLHYSDGGGMSSTQDRQQTPLPYEQAMPNIAERTQRIRRRLERLLGIAATEGNALCRSQRRRDLPGDAGGHPRRGTHRRHDDVRVLAWRHRPRFARALADRARGGRTGTAAAGRFRQQVIERDLLTRWTGRCPGRLVPQTSHLSPLKQNHRCHRKVLVVDEQTAFTGGVGIAEEWCGDARDEHEWRDTHVQVEDPRWTASRPPSPRTGRNATTTSSTTATDSPQQPAGRAVVQVVRGSASLGWQDMQTLLRVMIELGPAALRLATAYFSTGRVFHRTAVRRRAARRGGGDPVARPVHRQTGLPAGRSAFLRRPPRLRRARSSSTSPR